MPELPEVETIRRVLETGAGNGPAIVGRRIHGGRLLWGKTLATPSRRRFWSRLRGEEIQAVERRAKYLILRLRSETMLIHLRMSGDIIVQERGAPLPNYSRLYLDLDRTWRLIFTDSRKFGRVWLTRDPQEILSPLGPEPLDRRFRAPEFASRLRGRRRQIKPLLLDQTFLAGMGNIYTDEALHLARLHPLTTADRIGGKRANALLRAIRRVLREGIRRQGASIDWIYRGGGFQYHFRVYQRTGEPCRTCGTPIRRIVVGQRGTHFCPRCQRRR